MKGAEWFSTIDLASGFHKVPMKGSEAENTALLT